MLNYSKSEKSEIFGLMSVIIANIVFGFAFCCLFVSDAFYYEYYNWLKLVDLLSFVLILAGIVFALVLSNKWGLNFKRKYSTPLWSLLFTVQTLLLIVVFLNIISFYEGPVFVFLTIGLSFFALGVLVWTSFYISDDAKNKLHTKQLKMECVKIYQNKIIKSVETSKITDKTTIVNYKFLLGFILSFATLCFLMCSFFLGYPQLTEPKNLKHLFLCVCVVFVLIVLCGFGGLLFKTSLKNFVKNAWIVYSVIALNFMLFLLGALFVYFCGMQFVSLFIPLIMMGCCAFSNILLATDLGKMLYLKTNINQ